MPRAALAFLAALLAALAAQAQAPDPGEAIVLAVKVNQVQRGDAVVVPIEGSADLWVRERDSAKFGLKLPPPGEESVRAGEFLRLHHSPQLSLAVDLDKLELAIEASPTLLARQDFSLNNRPVLVPVTQAGANGFLNYGIGRQTFSGTAATVTGDLLVNLAVSDWVLRSGWTYASAGREAPVARGESQVLHDDVPRMLRWSFGDVQPATAFGGRSVPLAGIAVERLFSVSPGFIANPTASFSGNVRSPTVAEVYVDGARVRTISLAPGTYEFRDLSYFSGLRNVEIVLRDRAGNTETLRMPVYFSGENLRAGLHEFRYAAGSPRTSFEGDGTYGGGALSAWHRYGVTDALTVSANVEAFEGYRAAGAGAMAVLGDYGIVSANVVASRSDAGGEGHTELATYSYGGPDLSASLVAFRQSREFGTGAVAGISLAPGRPRERIGGGFGTSIGPQRTLTVDASRGRTWDGPADSIIAVRIAQGFENGASLSLAAVRRDDGTARGTDIAVSLSIPLGRGITFNAATEQRAAKGSRQTATASGPVPAGEGFGWRVDAEREAGLVGAGGFVQDNQPFATITGAARRLDSRGAGASTGTDLRFAGAVVGIGERVFLTRPIAQSFALAEVPGVPGVRMYQNSQLIGRTDATGQLLVPALGGYGVNQVSLDDRDVPMDRELKEVRREVVPRDFVGTVLSFEAKRVSALGGILVATVGGQPVRVVSAELTVRGGKAERTAITGPDGDFYLDDLEPGRYEIEALNRRLNCRAEVTLAEGKVPFVDLGEVRCHAMAK